jgi:NADPH-dependent ferric siderophore reductase
MLTYLPAVVERDNRAPYRPFLATVKNIRELSPSFRRVTFTGADMEWFASHCRDQRVKILFPQDGREASDIGTDGDWYAHWRALPAEERSPFRTYTVRAVRPALRELDIDFFWHGDDGPAGSWLATAAVGDGVTVVGPDVRSLTSSVGMDWRPGQAIDVLLVGDETAAPAICGILESLPAAIRAHAFIQVPTSADAMTVETSADVTLDWLARDSDPRSLDDAVRAWALENVLAYRPALSASSQVLEEIDVDAELLWDSPEAVPGAFYAWLAGEAGVIKGLRRLLVSEVGIDRSRVAFMGYWRAGKAEAQG